jgi:hypothetical protein
MFQRFRVESLDETNRTVATLWTSLENWLSREIWDAILPNFRPRMSTAEKSQLLDATAKMAEISDKIGVTYFLYSGSLLGSWRHHDVIPWDDDVDIIVNVSCRAEFRHALVTMAPLYGVHEAGPRLKFCSPDSRRHSRLYPWGWPYVDVSFFAENETHVWDAAPEYQPRRYVYPKSDVFPLHRRPLAGLWLPAPRDSYASLRATYRSVIERKYCVSSEYSHKFEETLMVKEGEMASRWGSVVRCERLKDFYTFVHRRASKIQQQGGVGVVVGNEKGGDSGVEETGMIGDSVVGGPIVVPEPVYALTHPFRLELLQEPIVATRYYYYSLRQTKTGGH